MWHSSCDIVTLLFLVIFAMTIMHSGSHTTAVRARGAECVPSDTQAAPSPLSLNIYCALQAFPGCCRS